MGDWEIDKDETTFGSAGPASPVVSADDVKIEDSGTGYYAGPTLQDAYDTDGVTIDTGAEWDPSNLTDEEMADLLEAMRGRGLLPPAPTDRPKATAQMVVETLLKRPGLAWDVFGELQRNKFLLGPWVWRDQSVEGGTEVWIRNDMTQRAGAMLWQAKDGKWTYHPTQDIHIQETDLDQLKHLVDGWLEAEGFLLVK